MIDPTTPAPSELSALAARMRALTPMTDAGLTYYVLSPEALHALCDGLESAAEALAGCVAALERYGQHGARCPAGTIGMGSMKPFGSCTCGLAEALAAGRAALSGG